MLPEYLLLCLVLLCFGLPLYSYIVYPFILMGIESVWRINFVRDKNYRPSVSIIIAAYNEEKVIKDKVENLLKLNYPRDKINFLIGSDGSTDATMNILNKYAHVANLRAFSFPRGGKVSVLNKLLSYASGDIVVFSDANTMFDADAIAHLVECFVDTRIGCVSGQLRLLKDKNSGLGAQGESVYWKYENWVKQLETRLGMLSGANGAIYAIRRELCTQIPAGIINDDFFISTYILQSGYNVIMNEAALAYEEPNDSLESQFMRHIRDGAGHYQALSVFKSLLSPTQGFKSFVYVSHRVIRWMVPFALLIAFILNLILVTKGTIFFLLFIVQAGGYLLMALYYFLQRAGWRNKLVNIPFYFLCVNLSLLIGSFKYYAKRQGHTWETQR